ncbi:PMEI domain-containing protein [Forsythia ovata]|uniref:PMEI domain-containing protein n=1 Tax=Forsythia ovata TaxID=205694 RepID=A0ABD1PWF1_9LAMI
MDLLQIAVDSAMDFGNKTYVFLKNMSKDKKTKPDLKPVNQECLAAYEGFISHFKDLIAEAKTEPALATYDSLLAREEIHNSISALASVKNLNISARNKIAEDYYTKLCIKIADFLET